MFASDLAVKFATRPSVLSLSTEKYIESETNHSSTFFTTVLTTTCRVL